MSELDKYLKILDDFGFEIRCDDEDIKRRYYVYSEKDRYTNINWDCEKIEIHTNYKSFITRKDDCNLKEGDFQNLILSTDYCGYVYDIDFKCDDTDTMLKYLCKLYY